MHSQPNRQLITILLIIRLISADNLICVFDKTGKRNAGGNIFGAEKFDALQTLFLIDVKIARL